MPDTPADPDSFRLRRFPPPQFPPRQPALFARMPPAVFPVLMGFLGCSLALRRGLLALGLDPAPAEALQGLAVGLWAFALLGYGVKLARRPGVIFEDLRVLPGRAGLAAGSLGILLVAAILVPWWPGVARGVLVAGLVLHAVLAGLIILMLLRQPPEARELSPAWHLFFVGFIIGGLAAVPLGHLWLVRGLLWLTVPVALAIWAASAWQFARRVPPAPLRPLLAVHLAPASLFASVAGLAGFDALATGFGALAVAIAVALLAVGRWLLAAGFSPLWGALTFPLAALAGALVLLGQALAGMVLLVPVLGLTLYVLVRVMSAWAKGGLAARTNAAEA